LQDRKRLALRSADTHTPASQAKRFASIGGDGRTHGNLERHAVGNRQDIGRKVARHALRFLRGGCQRGDDANVDLPWALGILIDFVREFCGIEHLGVEDVGNIRRALVDHLIVGLVESRYSRLIEDRAGGDDEQGRR